MFPSTLAAETSLANCRWDVMMAEVSRLRHTHYYSTKVLNVKGKFGDGRSALNGESGNFQAEPLPLPPPRVRGGGLKDL